MENNTNKRINLLQIVNGFAIGGAEKNLLELVRLTDKKKYRVVICSVGQGGPLQREFEALGLNVYVVTKKHRLDVSQVFNVAEIMRNERVDIVQMTLFYAEIIGILAALLAKVKIRISWEVYTHSKKFRHRLAYRLIYKLVNCVIAVSDTGDGMDEAFIRDRLFRPFDSTKGTQGMGIGAYQMRETILSMGGHVAVSSEPKSGTQVTITLKVADC